MKLRLIVNGKERIFTFNGNCHEVSPQLIFNLRLLFPVLWCHMLLWRIPTFRMNTLPSSSGLLYLHRFYSPKELHGVKTCKTIILAIISVNTSDAYYNVSSNIWKVLKCLSLSIFSVFVPCCSRSFFTINCY
jgi:hypothetical protein